MTNKTPTHKNKAKQVSSVDYAKTIKRNSRIGRFVLGSGIPGKGEKHYTAYVGASVLATTRSGEVLQVPLRYESVDDNKEEYEKIGKLITSLTSDIRKNEKRMKAMLVDSSVRDQLDEMLQIYK